MAPETDKMNLCNIHFHKGAEHRSEAFSIQSDSGGYIYSNKLTKGELENSNKKEHKDLTLNSGDTIEVHFVYSTADVSPGEGLGAYAKDLTVNPQLHVEAQVFVLVDEKTSKDVFDFRKLTAIEVIDSKYQAKNIKSLNGKTVKYIGSTTGNKYDKTDSPYQVTWSVRKDVKKLGVNSVRAWCESNIFNESHAHNVRQLVTDPKKLSKILL